MERHGAALEILFEDRELLVCRKPAGLPVQSASFGTKDMVSMLRTYLAEKGAKGGVPYVGVVHRLDQPVEGVIVFAKNQKSAAGLSAQAADGRMEKVYQAVVLGNPGPEGHLTDWLLKDGRTNTSRVVEPGTKGAKKAELSYRTLAEKDGKTLVEIRLHTGRHHQIRVQFAKMGTPLWGDRKYGPAAPAAAPSGETERPQASVEATVPSGEAERPQASVEVTGQYRAAADARAGCRFGRPAPHGGPLRGKADVRASVERKENDLLLRSPGRRLPGLFTGRRLPGLPIGRHPGAGRVRGSLRHPEIYRMNLWPGEILLP